jgi:integrase
VGPTKTDEERVIRVPERLVDALRRHRKAQLEERAASSSWEDPSLIFPNTRGGVWRHQGMFVAFKRDLVTAALPKEVRFHDLRHAAATLMFKKQVQANVASRVLGHSDPAMTLRRYAHALPGIQEIAADVMEGYAF